MSWESFIGVMKDIVVVVAPATAAIVAVLGLGTWKRQLKGQSDYNLAKDVLINLFKYRDALYLVRSPLMTEQELKLPEGKEAGKLRYNEERYLRTLTAYQNRWDKVVECRAKIQANIIEIETLWGEELASKLRLLFREEFDLIFEIERYLRIINPYIDQEDKQYDSDNLNRKLIYDTLKDETDEFRKNINQHLKPLQEALRGKLRK